MNATPDQIKAWWAKEIATMPYEDREQAESLGVHGYVISCYEGWKDEDIMKEDPEFLDIRKSLTS